MIHRRDQEHPPLANQGSTVAIHASREETDVLTEKCSTLQEVTKLLSKPHTWIENFIIDHQTIVFWACSCFVFVVLFSFLRVERAQK